MKVLEIFGHRTTDMNIIVRPYGSEFCHCRPDTTWERENKDFYSPECVNEIWWTPVVFARVCKAGKCVGSKFVERYYDGVGCGMLMYCVVESRNGLTEVSGDPRLRFAQPPRPATAGCSLQKPTGLFAYRSRGWHVTYNLLSIHSDRKTTPPCIEDSRLVVECADHTSVLPMPLYNAVVMENEGNEYGVEIGGMTVPVIGTEGAMESGKAKELLEETICKASELTSLRIGDFVAVELEGMKRLTSRETGSVRVKGTFCENEIFDFNVIF